MSYNFNTRHCCRVRKRTPQNHFMNVNRCEKIVKRKKLCRVARTLRISLFEVHFYVNNFQAITLLFKLQRDFFVVLPNGIFKLLDLASLRNMQANYLSRGPPQNRPSEGHVARDGMLRIEGRFNKFDNYRSKVDGIDNNLYFSAQKNRILHQDITLAMLSVALSIIHPNHGILEPLKNLHKITSI